MGARTRSPAAAAESALTQSSMRAQRMHHQASPTPVAPIRLFDRAPRMEIARARDGVAHLAEAVTHKNTNHGR